MIADFRSDTLTQPTAAMRRAMAEAPVGDDVFGEDPTVRELEERGAEVLGQEAAVYVPSGTMANQAAVHVHCRPGDELICDSRSHVFRYEAGAVARWSGTQIQPIETTRGFPDADGIRAAQRADDPHFPHSRLLVLENTHNMGGGAVLAATALQDLVSVARDAGLLVHIDGARLMNAAVAQGCQAADLTRGVDSVSLCLSKGLGAPVGSLLAGSATFVRAARRVRKALGGGMRQAGVLAAAGLIALTEGPGWVADDHRRAARLGAALAELPWLRGLPVETNIVIVDLLEGDADALLQHLAAHSVRALTVGPGRLRFVTHHDLNDAAIDRCITAASAWRPAPADGTAIDRDSS
ncbi:MAG: GntG family PLP-dependent aldolase [Planctomycetota bacterium]